MESWRTVYSFHMQTRTITWSKLQKFKEFGQGLKWESIALLSNLIKGIQKPGTEHKPQAPFGCLSQILSAFAAAPNTILLRGWCWPLYWQAAIKVGSPTPHSPFASPTLPPPSLNLRLSRINSVIWLKTLCWSWMHPAENKCQISTVRLDWRLWNCIWSESCPG